MRKPARSAAARKTPVQRLLPLPRGRGGARKGAGRPPGRKGLVRHRQRDALAARFPVHVTVRLQRGLPRLRQKVEHAALRAAMGAARNGPRSRQHTFHLCHYAILDNHLHFVVEADDREHLVRGVQGLLVRVARILNRLWRRRGRVFADRYHDHILRSPRQTRNAILYVLANGKKHAAEGGVAQVSQAIDTFTSAPWFDGFREDVRVRGIEAIERPVADARTWLLRAGWRRHGLLSVHEMPATG